MMRLLSKRCFLIKIGDYNSAVRAPFKFAYDPDTVCVLIISTPNMFDVSFKRWIKLKCKEVCVCCSIGFHFLNVVHSRILQLGSLEAVAETISSPIQEFLQSRLEPVCEVFSSVSLVVYSEYSCYYFRSSTL